jgi:hypothetical protein
MSSLSIADALPGKRQLSAILSVQLSPAWQVTALFFISRRTF